MSVVHQIQWTRRDGLTLGLISSTLTTANSTLIGFARLAQTRLRTVTGIAAQTEGKISLRPLISGPPKDPHRSQQAHAAAWQPFLVPQPDGRLGIDLVGFCVSECEALGIGRAQLFVEPMDTAADDGQFSHYAGTEGGRPHKQGRLICYGYLGSR